MYIVHRYMCEKRTPTHKFHIIIDTKAFIVTDVLYGDVCWTFYYS